VSSASAGRKPDVLAVPYDIPIPGYRKRYGQHPAPLEAAATDAFDLGEFNAAAMPNRLPPRTEAENYHHGAVPERFQ